LSIPVKDFRKKGDQMTSNVNARFRGEQVGGTVSEAGSWFIGRTFDLSFIIVGGIMTSLLLYLTYKFGTGFLTVAALFAIVADFPHVLETHVRILFDPEEYRVYRREFWGSLLIIGTIVGYFAAIGEAAFLVMIWVYWQPLHNFKQHFGVIALYTKKAGIRAPISLARAVLFLGCAAPILWRIAFRGLHFGNYRIFGLQMPFSGVSIPLVPVPPSAVVLAYIFFGLTVALFVVEQARMARLKRALPFSALAILACAVFCYNFAYIFVDDLFAVLLIATAVHPMQYHTLCWMRNNRKFSSMSIREYQGRAKLLAMLSQKRALPFYGAAMIGLGGLCALSESVAFTIPLVIILHHFYLDGVIWKSQRNPALLKDLGLEPYNAR
jgi:hypothetical protein